MIGFERDTDSVVIDYGKGMLADFERWIVKSRSSDDPPDIGPEEQAYALMARSAGVRMADTHLFRTRKGNRLFATRRFDRTSDGRLHTQTASRLLNASHRTASVNYETWHKLVFLMTRDSEDVLQMFRRMVFNIYARNRDDHAKNHALLMDAAGAWRLSPAYDLTFSLGLGGEHSADVAGEGRVPDISHMLRVAAFALIKPSVAKISLMRSAVRSPVGRHLPTKLVCRRCADLNWIVFLTAANVVSGHGAPRTNVYSSWVGSSDPLSGDRVLQNGVVRG
jgi:serine/threonine-protein kinase HipA